MKNLVQMEFKGLIQGEPSAPIVEKLCHFLCEPDTPIDVVKEALLFFLRHVGNIEDQIKQQTVAESEEVPEMAEAE